MRERESGAGVRGSEVGVRLSDLGVRGSDADASESDTDERGLDAGERESDTRMEKDGWVNLWEKTVGGIFNPPHGKGQWGKPSPHHLRDRTVG